MKTISTTCGLVLFGFLATAGCTSTPETATTNSQVSAACQQAEDDCKTAFDAVAAEGTALEATCENIGPACQGGPSAACTQAKDDCTSAMQQLEQDASSATASCTADVGMNCSPGSGGGSGSGSGSGSGGGGGSGGLSAACEMAIDDCLQQTQTVLQGIALPNCGASLVSACLDPNNAAGCQAALAACMQDAQDLQSSAGAIAAQCSQEVTAACQ